MTPKNNPARIDHDTGESGVVRACSAQITGFFEDPEKTIEKADVFIRHAAQSGASLICFPEQFATGWDPGSDKNTGTLSGLIVSSLQKSARDHSIAVLGSFREIASPRPRNTAVVIGNDGRILATYAKIHLFSPAKEDVAFSPGSTLGIFQLGPLTCGIAICYDLRFPELFRIYAQKGVQAIFVPAAWPMKRIRHWELFLTARATENQMYMIGVNTTGKTPVDTYSGSSMTVDPLGVVIARANDAEQLLFADLHVSEVRLARESFPSLRDRRDALYRSLTHSG
ncbi:nitrilase-related carbon-nitrogen hydrolase [uncultured Methanoregula sp.]|uniref:nitrilase-related carbon-nitrogen hydrolase n=1 Tax=uncultured Methanoregula sp. TaxID=1005933 RepID=UPI002AAC04AD|nr:nitrilase-related carbon-nitrogen hydrolase [uncultured Methanoregula sp.]